MAALHLLGWARSEVMCRDMAGLPPGTLYLLTLPVMTSSASKHSPTELGTRGTEKEGVPTFLVSMVSNQEMCRKAQRCSSNLDSQKATGWNVAPSASSLKLCV